MLYIITEDSNSGYEFWVEVNRLLLQSKACIIKGHGITTVYPAYEKLCKSGNLNKEDAVLLAIDNTRSPLVTDLLSDVYDLISQYNIRTYNTKYHSFEEIFISFSHIIDWVNTLTEEEKAFVSYIRDCIIDGTDFMEEHGDNEDIFNNILLQSKKTKQGKSTREAFISTLLDVITKHNKGFSITKTNIGVCWVEDCCKYETEIKRNSKSKDIRFIKRCGLKQFLSAQEKLRVLIENSIIEILTPHFIDELQALT